MVTVVSETVRNSR